MVHAMMTKLKSCSATHIHPHTSGGKDFFSLTVLASMTGITESPSGLARIGLLGPSVSRLTEANSLECCLRPSCMLMQAAKHHGEKLPEVIILVRSCWHPRHKLVIACRLYQLGGMLEFTLLLRGQSECSCPSYNYPIPWCSS